MGFMVFAGLIGFIAGVLHICVKSAILTDFEVINGPVVPITKMQFDTHNKHSLKDVAIRVLLIHKKKESEVYFRAPVFFRHVSETRQRELVKRSLRMAEIANDKILCID